VSDGIAYRISIPAPHTHLVEVEGRAGGVFAPVQLVMPSWTPGSYLIREFPRNVQELRAESGSGRPVRSEKLDKNSWRVDAPDGGVLVWRYRVYANELTVRTSHVDASHASLNGASVFLYVRGRESEPIEVEVSPPAGWSVHSALVGEESGRLRAANYAQLVDSPIEVGTPEVLPFTVDGIPHRYVIWGTGNHDAARLVRDTRSIVQAARRMWDSLPYDRFTFFLHLVASGRGGLEHRDSTLLQSERLGFRGADYESFLGLVAHEFFHVWNGTRIRPEPLVDPDLTREAYTRNLWVVEGLTTYYTDLLLLRARIISEQRYLTRLSEVINRYLSLPGRLVQPLEEASFDAWIKFYRQDERSPNAQISYYLKGALVGLLLDMRIRGSTGNRRSLDDVMRLLWQRYGAEARGFPEDHGSGVRAIAEEVAGEELGDLFTSYVDCTTELDFDPALSVFGLRLDRTAGAAGTPAGDLAVLGCKVDTAAGRATVAHVLSGSPAETGGLNAKDEVIGVGGLRVDAGGVVNRIRSAETGKPLRLTVSRRGELLELEVVPRKAPPRVRIVRDGHASPEQVAMRTAWLEGGAEDGG
jgi:predicted metalloprotease with PDZ domain